MPGTAAVRAERIIEQLFGPVNDRDFAIRLWDGKLISPPGQAAFTVVFNHPGALRRMFLPPSELAIGEAFIRGDFDLEGQIELAPGLSELLIDRLSSPVKLAKLEASLLRLPKSGDAAERPLREIGLEGEIHSADRDGIAVRYHYDIGNDFWTYWLDERMVYSCAYFEDETKTLDEAQEAKLDLVCRKLRLKPGESLLDIGCGWGSLIQYAAEKYGVSAVGITLSQEQVDLARKRIADAGLADRVTVELRDYRELAPSMTFDKVASLGMVEHVGHEPLPLYFQKAFEATKPGGLFLVHGITNTSIGASTSKLRQRFVSSVWKEASFFYRYIFPDSEIPKQPEMVLRGEEAGFELRDFESIREHYPLTLNAWRARLEENHAEIAEVVGEPTYRTWRFYLASSSWAFTHGRLGVAQSLFSRPDEQNRTHLPLTRQDLLG